MIEVSAICPYIINMDKIKVGDLVKYRPDVLEDIDFDTQVGIVVACLLYTSPSPRDRYISRMPSSA